MSLSATEHAQLGQILYDAMRANTPIQPLTKTHPTITVEDAYQISRTMLSHRLERDREVVVGKKIGVTSDAVQSMLGVFHTTTTSENLLESHYLSRRHKTFLGQPSSKKAKRKVLLVGL